MINLKAVTSAVTAVAEYKVYIISATALIALISTVWIKCDNDRTNTLIGESTGEIIHAKDTIEKIKDASKTLEPPSIDQVKEDNKNNHSKDQDNDASHF
tara:strand:- start:2276 stop:2572 length:297 start_codon:yes stop_codon:yes gene_type:complete